MKINLRVFRGVVLKKRTDGLTDGRVKSIIVVWGKIKLNSKIHLCHGSFYVSNVIGCQMRFLK